VQPLRAIRGRLKTGPLPAPTSETEPFRSPIKAAELAAERLQNRLLAEHVPPERDILAPEDLHSVLRSVVMLALEKRPGKPLSDLHSSIDAVVDAAMRDTH
jgi:hypothetical protein